MLFSKKVDNIKIISQIMRLFYDFSDWFWSSNRYWTGSVYNKEEK